MLDIQVTGIIVSFIGLLAATDLTIIFHKTHSNAQNIQMLDRLALFNTIIIVIIALILFVGKFLSAALVLLVMNFVFLWVMRIIIHRARRSCIRINAEALKTFSIGHDVQLNFLINHLLKKGYLPAEFRAFNWWVGTIESIWGESLTITIFEATPDGRFDVLCSNRNAPNTEQEMKEKFSWFQNPQGVVGKAFSINHIPEYIVCNDLTDDNQRQFSGWVELSSSHSYKGSILCVRLRRQPLDRNIGTIEPYRYLEHYWGVLSISSSEIDFFSREDIAQIETIVAPKLSQTYQLYRLQKLVTITPNTFSNSEKTLVSRPKS